MIDKRQHMAWLAARVLEDRRASARMHGTHNTPWYMMNINHPAVEQLYIEYRSKNDIKGATGDIDRTLWELSLLSENTLQQLTDYYRRKAEAAAQIAAAIGDKQ